MKSTKVIAGLGIVAALGVAALPFGGAFAETPAPVANGATTTTQATSDDDDVTVQVMVDDTIAIRITGSEQIWTWDATNSEWVVFAQDNQASFDGTTQIEGPITAIEMTNNDLKTLNNNVYVTTNSLQGYNLYVKANNSTALRHYSNASVDADALTDADKNIPAVSALTTLAKGTAGWGLRAANADTTTGATVAPNFADATAVTGAPLDASDPSAEPPVVDKGALVYTSGAKAYDSDKTVITYGVATSGTQAAGLYQASLTYTAAIQE
ncbi:hypothetical protein IJH97_01510 [Candidatus Saccharibacteria bacterium]|nr:hypothetical protein [Candidatus Saccharibacteria bacterium]